MYKYHRKLPNLASILNDAFFSLQYLDVLARAIPHARHEGHRTKLEWLTYDIVKLFYHLCKAVSNIF